MTEADRTKNKYRNTAFDMLVKEQSALNSPVINDLIKCIKQFYEDFNKKIDRCTPRYAIAVETILNQFPVYIKDGVNGQKVYSVSGKQVYETIEIETALKGYVEKFKSIKYLDFLSEENRNVVFVGPNGSGKTTLLRKLKNDTQDAKIYYYPADRVLLVNEHFNPKRAYESFVKDLNDNYQYATDIDYGWQGSKIIEQFDYLINLLEKERNEENEKRIVNGVTERIIKKWGELVKDRELFFEYGLCVRPIGGKKYPLKYLSSGEKSILFFLIGILLQEKKDFYFIDEPENNLNPAIVSKLWDFIEREMPESVFVYLTHDSDFVASRTNAKIYWIEKYDGENWSWKELPENKDLPKELTIQLAGSREPVIFCESKNEYKLDARLFKKMFPEFKVVSASGCAQVEIYVKAYKTLELPHKVYGIIDCDYRGQTYLDSMKTDNIYHLPFLEIENFLFSEKIIKKMIEKYSIEEDKQAVYDKISVAVKELFSKKKDEWIAKHVAFELKDKFDYRGKVKPLTNLRSFKELYNSERKTDKEIDDIADTFKKRFEEILECNDYNLILRHLDHKGLMVQFKHILKLKDNLPYEDAVFALFQSADGEKLLFELRQEYLSYITP